MKKYMLLLLLLFSIITSILIGQTLPEKIIVGYWHNWEYSPNTLLLTEIPEAYDVINIAFATPTEPFGSTMQFCPDPGIYPNPDDFVTDIVYLQNLGKKVVVSIGGANDPVVLLNSTDVQNFVTSMSGIITTYGFDGLDIDLEGGSVSLDAGDNDFRYPTTPKIVNLIDAITQLTDLMSEIILTAAPETAYVQGGYCTYAGIWGAYLPIIHALRDRLTLIHVQHYNTGSMYGRDGNLYYPLTADFHVAMADMLLAGFQVDVWGGNIFFDPLEPMQVAIGLPASNSAAGSGYTEPDIVHTALDYIILGIPFSGQYQLSNPEGYFGFRGLMTWSINWDVDNNCEFSNAHRTYLDYLIGVSVFDNNYLEEIQNLITLKNNFPNPFSSTTTISFSLTTPIQSVLLTGQTENTRNAELIIYNIKGQKVKQFKIQNLKIKINEVVWDGKDDKGNELSSGIYFYKLNACDFQKVKKMILMK